MSMAIETIPSKKKAREVEWEAHVDKGRDKDDPVYLRLLRSSVDFIPLIDTLVDTWSTLHQHLGRQLVNS